MASQLSLGKFFKGVPEKRKSVGTENKKNYEKRRSRGFIESWKKDFEGIEDTENGMICKYCADFKDISGPSSFTTGYTSYRIESIRSHFASPKHQQCTAAYLQAQRRANNDNLQGPLYLAIRKLGKKNKTLIMYMFNTVYCVMKEELPFTLYPTLLKLQIKHGSDLARLQSYQSDKACARFAPYVAEAIREPLQNNIQNCKVLSIMYDGATDSSVTEVEIVYCRILENGYPKDYFVGLQDLEHAHADGVFSAIDEAMNKNGSEHWKDKVVGGGSDGASVNLGVNNSVATRLSDGRPYVLNVHCVAHRLQLGIFSAIKTNANLITVQDMLKKNVQTLSL